MVKQGKDPIGIFCSYALRILPDTESFNSIR